MPTLASSRARTRRLALALVVSVVAPLSAGWSGAGASTRSGEAVVRQAAAALEDAPFFVVAGYVGREGEKLSLDLASVARGARAAGQVTSDAKQLGFVGTVRFVFVDRDVYLYARSSFWDSTLSGASAPLRAATVARLVRALSDRWIEVSGSEAATFSRGFGDLTNPAGFARSLFEGAGPLSIGAALRFNGHLAEPVESPTNGTLYVAARGEPLPLGISAHTASLSGTVLFAYPASLRIEAPSSSRTLESVAASIG